MGVQQRPVGAELGQDSVTHWQWWWVTMTETHKLLCSFKQRRSVSGVVRREGIQDDIKEA